MFLVPNDFNGCLSKDFNTASIPVTGIVYNNIYNELNVNELFNKHFDKPV